MKNLTLLILTLLICLANVAAAEEGPCKADIEKFCKGILPGDGRIVSCLKSHEGELSAECKAKGTEIKQKIQDFQVACKEDIKTICKGILPGKGRILSCLKSNETKLSAGCKAAMTSEPSK